MASLPITSRLRLAHAAGNATHLLSLDGVWTAHSGGGSSSELGALSATVDQMETLLAGLSVQGRFLSQTAEEVGEEGIAEIVDRAPVPDDVKAAARRRAEQDGGWVTATVKRAQTLQEVMTGEREEVASQFEKIRSGAAAQGDMSARAKCVIGFICLFSEAGPVVAAGVVLIATNC
jgi:hypothetical protein